jgi:hypothetical protein
MSNTSDQWGLYPWFEEHGMALIHPDDLDDFRRLAPYGKVFLRAGEEAGFTQLVHGSRTFRVKPDLFQPIPAITFPVGTRVRIRDKNVDAVIDSIQWHHRDARPIYFVRRDGKVESRRYLESDLAIAES